MQQGKAYLPAQRQAILQDALDQIQQGIKLEDIAASHGIAHRTLQYWLLALGDDYIKIRQAHTDAMVNDALQAIADVAIPNKADYTDMRELDSVTRVQSLRLAREVATFKSISWLAERRDARYRNQAISVSVDNAPRIIDMSTLTDEQLRSVALITVKRDQGGDVTVEDGGG